MLRTCKCGVEFLTEVDPYVVIPSPKGYEHNCGCYYKKTKEFDVYFELTKDGRLNSWSPTPLPNFLSGKLILNMRNKSC